MNQSSFEGRSVDNVLINSEKKVQNAYPLKSAVYEHIIFIRLPLVMK